MCFASLTLKNPLILLTDYHEVVRAGLRDALLRLVPDCSVVEAETFEGALSAIADQKPDLILLDLYMPGMNGEASIRAAIEAAPETPVAVFSGIAKRRDIESAMLAGAQGFIPKSMKVAAMANAILLILNGDKYLPYSYLADQQNAAFNLTPREREVLGAISEGKSNKQIARDLSIEEVTVKLHATNVFRKLKVSNRTEAALKATELDLI